MYGCVHTRHFWNESVPWKVWIKRRICQKNYEGTSSCRKRHPWSWRHILLALSLQAGFRTRLHKTGQAPVPFSRWGSAEAECQELPSPTVGFTPGHSTEQLGPPLGKDMLNGMLRDNGAHFKDAQSSSMDLTRDKVKAAPPRGWSKGAMIPTGLI